MDLQCHKKEMELKLLTLLGPVCAQNGFELVDLVWTSDRKLIVFADILDEKQPSITLNACAELSEILSRFLDVEDPIQENYTLEVSSPGLERPLRTLQHFRKMMGRDIKAKLLRARPLRLEGKVPQYNLKGILTHVSDDGMLTLSQEQGEGVVSIRDIESAHVCVDWNQADQGANYDVQ